MKHKRTWSGIVLSACLTGSSLAQQVVLSDDFESGVLASHWSFDAQPFETGEISIGGGLVDGAMRLEVSALSDFWGGFALRTERTFAASVEKPLTFEVTRVADEGVGVTRSGAWIMNSDRSQYLFFAQNIGEGGWQYNRRIGQAGDNATGAGINIDAFDALDEDFDSHDIRLVANGATVQIFLDGQFGAEVDFPLADGIVCGFGSYARSVDDDAVASFDDVRITSDLPTGLPCVTLSAQSTALFAGEGGQATLSVPRLYVAENAVNVTITSSNPDVATFEGADGQGVLNLSFAAGGESSRLLTILAGKGGAASFDIAVSDPLCAGNALNVSVSSSFLRNPSFEDSPRPEGVGYGEIGDWQGGSGINDGGPFGDNGTIPDRAQIAFSQGGRALSQEVSGLDPSKLYHVQFYYNARNCCGGTIGLSVTYNDQQIGEVIESIQPVGGTKPYHLFMGAFQPATASGTLSLTTTAAGDATLLFDAVSITERSLDDLQVVNASFESSGRVAAPGYLASIAGWDVVGQAGVNVGGSGPFADNGETPDQDLVAFIQGAGSSISQTLTSFVVGETYVLTYATNARGANAPILKVLLDEQVLSEETITPVGEGNAYLIKTVEFTATSVVHAIRFEQTAAGDSTVLLDNVLVIGEASMIPCVPVTPESFTASLGQTGNAVTIAMPAEAVVDGPVTITVSNSNPAAFVFEGANAAGSVSLVFTQGGELTQSVRYEAVGKGMATFALSSSKALCFSSSAVTANALAAFVRNPGFESNYPEAWPHYGDIDDWARSGNAGTNLSDGPFHDNGLVPDGAQIGFAQGATKLTQEVGGFGVGESYWLQFHYNRRRDAVGAMIGFQVSLGDDVIFDEAEIVAVGADQPYYFAAIPFVATANAGALTFTPRVEGDATLLLDGVNIVKRGDNEILVVNPSFEATGAVTLPAPGYLGTEDGEKALRIAGWESTGNYGINASGSGVFANNGRNPDQDDVVFLQGDGSSIRQTISGLTTGETYSLLYSYNARSGNTPTLLAEIDGNVAQETTVLPVGGEELYHQHAFGFRASGERVELRFTQTAAGDQTLLLDDIHVIPGGDARPCVTISPGTLTLDEGTSGELMVRVPDEAFDTVEQVSVTLVSGDASVASVNGVLTFTRSGSRSQMVPVVAGAAGSAKLSITADDTVCLGRDEIMVTVRAVVVPRNLITNGTFESNSHATFPGYGPVDGWVKEGSGNVGINNADGPFHNSGTIPDRSQVALMQNSVSLSQELRGLEMGKQYWLQFYYNARAGEFARPRLTARVDGQDILVLDAIESVGDGESYHFISVPFVPAANRVMLQLESFVEAGGDGTVVLDAVTVTRRDSGEVVVVNPSFEASGLAAAPGYLQPAPVAGWTLVGGYGTNRSGEGPFADNGTNPDQDLVLFLQGASNATQVISGLTAGQTYTLEFGYNARNNNAPQLVVAIDELVVFDEVVNPVGGTADYHQARVMFTARGETATIALGQVADGDHTVLLDDLHIFTGNSAGGGALPGLGITTMEGMTVELSWPNAFTDLLLERSVDLENWSGVGDAVSDADGRFVVRALRDGRLQFYRLKRP